MRLVLDTNVVLDWLVFRDARIGPLVDRIERGTVRVITNTPCAGELARVLGYPVFGLPPDRQRSLYDHYLAATQRYDGPARPGFLPGCRDPDDQKFLELARDGDAGWLITKDKALLALARARRGLRGFQIVRPERWLQETASPATC